jgi:copper resistance protein B
MAKAEMAMMDPRSAPTFSAMRIDLAEYQRVWENPRAVMAIAGKAKAGLAIVNRLVLRTRGEGSAAAGWSRPNWKRPIRARSVRGGTFRRLSAGHPPDAIRTHAMLAVEGLAPYKFDVLAGCSCPTRGN